MNKKIQVILLGMTLLFCTPLFGQDKIILRSGEQIDTRVIEINKKDVVYKKLDDPEFRNYSFKEEDIDKIILENKKEYWFNHKLPRAYVMFFGGVAIPLGITAANDYNDYNDPGFKKTGFGIGLEAGFYFFKKLGLGLRYEHTEINWDTQTLESIQKQLFYDFSITTESSFNKRFEYNNILLGPIFSFKPTKWSTIDFKAFVGMVEHTPMEFSTSLSTFNTYSGTFETSKITYSNLKDNKINKRNQFGYSPGISFRAGGKRIAGMISVNYTFSEVSYEYPMKINDIEVIERSTRQLFYSTLTIYAGLVIQFNRKNR